MAGPAPRLHAKWFKAKARNAIFRVLGSSHVWTLDPGFPLFFSTLHTHASADSDPGAKRVARLMRLKDYITSPHSSTKQSSLVEVD